LEKIDDFRNEIFMSEFTIAIGLLLILLLYLVFNGSSNIKNKQGNVSKNRMFYFRALIIVSIGIILLILEMIK